MLVDAAKGIEDRTRKLFEVKEKKSVIFSDIIAPTVLFTSLIYAPNLFGPCLLLPVTSPILSLSFFLSSFFSHFLFFISLSDFWKGLPYAQTSYFFFCEQDGQTLVDPVRDYRSGKYRYTLMSANSKLKI